MRLAASSNRKYLSAVRALDGAEMSFLGNDNQISLPVVIFNSIDMMNVFPRVQRPAKKLRHDEAVFCNKPRAVSIGVIAHSQPDVSVFIPIPAALP